MGLCMKRNEGDGETLNSENLLTTCHSLPSLATQETMYLAWKQDSIST